MVGCQILATLTSAAATAAPAANSANAADAANAGGAAANAVVLATVMAAMGNHRDCASIQGLGCRVIHTAFEFIGPIPLDRLVSCRSSCRLLVLFAMARHRSDAGLQYSACKALLAISKNDNWLAVKREIIESVIDAMQSHPDDCQIQKVACEILTDVANNFYSMQSVIRNCGGIAQVTNAMMRHPTDADLHLAACTALNAFGDQDSRTVSSGALAAVIAAMAQEPNYDDLQHAGCQLITSLASSSNDHRHFIIMSNGIPAVVTALDSFFDTRKAFSGCLALLSLIDDQNRDDCQNRLRDCGGIDAVLMFMDVYPDCEPLQYCACQLLVQALHHNAWNTIDAIRHNGFFIVGNTTMRFADNDDLVQAANTVIALMNNIDAATATAIAIAITAGTYDTLPRRRDT